MYTQNQFILWHVHVKTEQETQVEDAQQQERLLWLATAEEL